MSQTYIFNHALLLCDCLEEVVATIKNAAPEQVAQLCAEHAVMHAIDWDSGEETSAETLSDALFDLSENGVEYQPWLVAAHIASIATAINLTISE